MTLQLPQTLHSFAQCGAKPEILWNYEDLFRQISIKQNRKEIEKIRGEYSAIYFLGHLLYSECLEVLYKVMNQLLAAKQPTIMEGEDVMCQHSNKSQQASWVSSLVVRLYCLYPGVIVLEKLQVQINNKKPQQTYITFKNRLF